MLIMLLLSHGLIFKAEMSCNITSYMFHNIKLDANAMVYFVLLKTFSTIAYISTEKG